MSKRIEIVRDKKDNPYLMIRMSKKDLDMLGAGIEAFRILIEEKENLK